MKKIICVLLIAVVLLTGSAALAANVPKPVLDARESTVYIEVENDEGVFSGSGFAIGTTDTIEYVVTNHHVIEGDNGTFTVYFGEYDSVNAAVEIDLPDIDACVLKLDTPISGMRPLVLYTGEPDKLTGERVYALGFPGSADSIFDRTGDVGQDVTITDGIISAVKESFAFGTGEHSATGLQMNASIFGGNSGGPLINENGVVAGINTFSSTQDSNLYGSLCISELLPSLDKKGIPYKASSNPLYSGMLWIYIIIAAAAVLFLLWFFKLRKMRHTKKQKTISFNEYLEKAGGILDYDFASRLLTPVARQVAELQRNGKCSLSIYPQNIRVRPETGEASLLPAKKQTLANGYSAPEQYKEFSQLGTWTDVYQLGALFYRVLTGERLPEVLARLEDDSHTQQKIDGLTLSDPEKKALKDSLSLKIESRLKDAASFLPALRIATATEPATWTASGPAAFQPQVAPVKKERKKMSTKKRNKIVAFSIIGGLVVVVCVLGGLFVTTYENAYALMKQGNYSKANQTISKLPEFTENVTIVKKISSAGMLAEKGQYDEAREELKELSQYDDARYILNEVDLMQGLKMIQDGKADEGEALINTYLSNMQDDADKTNVDYLRADAYFSIDDLVKAEEIYSSLGDYKEAYSQAKFCAAIMSANYMNQEEYEEALDILDKYSEDQEIEGILDTIYDAIYNEALTEYNSGNYYSAVKNFSLISWYENSQQYINIINATDYETLMPYLDVPGTLDILYSKDYLLMEYLVGHWTGGGYYFDMDDNLENTTSYNLPEVERNSNYYSMEENIYLLGDQNCFRFDVIDENTMNVYAYEEASIYRMNRQ